MDFDFIPKKKRGTKSVTLITVGGDDGTIDEEMPEETAEIIPEEMAEEAPKEEISLGEDSGELTSLLKKFFKGLDKETIDMLFKGL